MSNPPVVVETAPARTGAAAQDLAAATPQMAVRAARAASTKTSAPTVVLHVAALLGVTDAFVITSGTSARQVRAIADEVKGVIRGAGGPRPARVEGLDDARWVLLDYGDFVVHVFLEEARSYYDLERLWSDAPLVRWDAEGS